MNEILKIVLDNLIQLGVAGAVLLLAYMSNVILSMYYNIKITNFVFDKTKLINGTLKMLSLLIGGALLTICISLITSGVNEVSSIGIDASEISTASILLAIGLSVVYYVKDAIETLISIVTTKK